MNQQIGMVIAFDFGFSRIGMAVGHILTKSANPLPTILATRGVPRDWNKIKLALSQWRPDALIVGLPVNIDGTAQYVTEAARSFANELKTRFALPVYLVDERLSTKEAREQIFTSGGYQKLQKTEIDSIAACVILEQWFQHPIEFS